MQRLVLRCQGVIGLCALWTLAANASTVVSLRWNPSPDSSVVGYALYYGNASGSHAVRTDVQNRTMTCVSNLTPGLIYYFAVAAYTAGGIESLPSSEVAYLVPSDAPVIFKVTPGQAAQLKFVATRGKSWCVEVSDDGVKWGTMCQLNTVPNGWVEVFDPAAGYQPVRFYRVTTTDTTQVTPGVLQLSKGSSAQGAHLKFVASPGNTWRLQATEDLVRWRTIYQTDAVARQWVEMIDPAAASLPARFYRVVGAATPESPLPLPGALRLFKAWAEQAPQLRFVVSAGKTWYVQASEDLARWSTIYRLDPVCDGWVEVADPTAASLSKRFYRVAATGGTQ